MTAEQAVAAVLKRAGARDPDTLAAEILTVLRGHGWRPAAVRPRQYNPFARRAPDPPSDEYRQWRQQHEARPPP